MHRMLLRVAALALCTSALSACGTLDGGDTKPVTAASANTAPTVAPDLTAAIHQAQDLRNKGDLEGATHVISQLMLAQPDDARVVGEYGKLLVQEGRATDAVQFLHRAVELAPSDWTLYSALGVAYDQLSDPANAKLAYEQALVLKPGEPAILNNYGMSRMLAGDTAAAHALMAQAQASGSTDPKIAKNVALLDSMAPAPSKPAPAPVAALVAPQPHVAAAQPAPVTTAEIAPVSVAHTAPTPITRNGSKVVMQTVPVDPLAGRVTRTAHTAAKPASVAAKATTPPAQLAAAALPTKPVKDIKGAKPAALNEIPSLRMTADANKP